MVQQNIGDKSCELKVLVFFVKYQFNVKKEFK
jgi:hypothetical protein